MPQNPQTGGTKLLKGGITYNEVPPEDPGLSDQKPDSAGQTCGQKSESTYDPSTDPANIPTTPGADPALQALERDFKIAGAVTRDAFVRVFTGPEFRAAMAAV